MNLKQLLMISVLGLAKSMIQQPKAMANWRLTSSSQCSAISETIIQDILYRIRQSNQNPPFKCRNFVVDGQLLGKVSPNISNILLESQLFIESDSNSLTLSQAKAGNSCESRTAAVASVMQTLRDRGVIDGWRDELYPIASGFYQSPVFLMERAAVSLLGGLEYGIHINGLVRQEDNSEKMWIGRRSAQKSKYPGMLDHIVAGGQPAGLSLMENVLKECEEEAGIPPNLVMAGLKSAGAISYEHFDGNLVSRAVLFCYDLYLPETFIPIPTDGEVENFFLWDVAQIKASFQPDFHDPIKPNCYPVIADYLIRKGFLDPDTTGYLDVLRELRSGECK
jgi:8-oxo-dGTP pyrophosphatase MutT (NUDIX family)